MEGAGQCLENMVQKHLTDLNSFRSFVEEAQRALPKMDPGTYCMTAINIMHFHMFNRLRGWSVGNKLLCYIAGCMEEIREQYGGITGYFGGDNFCIIMPWDTKLTEKLKDDIIAGVELLGNVAGVAPVLGICVIRDVNLSPEILYDQATLAMSQATSSSQIVQYDSAMEKEIEEELQLLMEVEEALERDEFTFFAQPQCDIFSGKVVGAESLVRWRHSTKGLISPGRFIPVLERSGMIHLLDQKVWEKVCQWLRSWIDRGYEPVPISINISRIDIMSFDVPAYLLQLLEKYNLTSKYIKAEITESAYAEEDSRINSTVDRLREAGFLVMMDDFGSGYSSLNMLKSIPVDVLKIDMRFLEISDEEQQKGIGILESIVNMARLMGLPIIVEGVEEQHQENVLRNMGCRYTQGYYYYKPLPIEQFETLLADERKLDFTGLHCKQVEAFHVREFMDGNLFTDMMVNNILGPSAIYDVFENQIEITRVNEQYYQMSGLNMNDADLEKKLWNSVRDDDRIVMLSLFDSAYEKHPDGAEGNIHYLCVDGKVLWLHVRVFFLREKEGHRMFFISVSDITYLRERREERVHARQQVARLEEQEMERLEQYFGTLPCGYGLSRIVLDSSGEAVDYEIIYINREMERMCGSDIKRIRHLILKAFGDDTKELMQKAYQAAFLGDMLNHYAYSAISNHYLQMTLYQYEFGYVACLLRDVTHMQVYEDAFGSMVLAYREVYFLHLQDNYCRMLYPDEALVMERGNYEAMIERHFGTGRILKYDEENIRSFLSLQNLRTSLRTQNSVDYRYRRNSGDNSDEWCLTSVTISERDNGNPKTAVITIRSIDKIMKEEEERRQIRMAESLASMSDAFFIYRAIDDERIMYANPAVMEIFGCSSMTEFMEHVKYSFQGIVHPEDLERVEWEIENQIRNSEGNMDYVQYRIIRKDGQIRWVDDCGHLENSKWGEEHRLFYVFIKDITDSITDVQKEKLLNSNQFYQNGGLNISFSGEFSGSDM